MTTPDRQSLFRRGLALCLALGALGAGASSVLAGSSGPGMHPALAGATGYLDHTLAPGATQEDDLVLSNGDQTESDYRVYAVDAYTSPASGIVYWDGNHAPTGDGLWLSLERDSVHLEPGQGSTLHVTVRVPADARPGDHVGAVAAENAVPFAPTSGRLAVSVQNRTVVAVVVHVPGPVTRAFSVGHATLGIDRGRARQVLTVPMENGSDVLVRPELSGGISTCEGSQVVDLSRSLDSFVSHSRIDYAFYLEGRVLNPGCYQLRLDATGEGSDLGRSLQQFTVGSDAARLPGPHVGSVAVPAPGRPQLPGRTLGLVLSAAVLMLGTLGVQRWRRGH